MRVAELEATVAGLEATVARLEAVVADLVEQVAVRDAPIAELEAQLAASRRSGKRQAAPFSKGKPSVDPARPGRKRGSAHGRRRHRMTPADVDRIVDAPLPRCCPHCGDGIEPELRICRRFRGIRRRELAGHRLGRRLTAPIL